MIGKLLGHTYVQTTARYAHLANESDELSECGSTMNSRRPGLVTARAPEQREVGNTDPGARTSNTTPLAGDTKEASSTNPSQSLRHPVRTTL